MAITRTAMVDDDGSGTTGTIINNAWKQELYGQIDGLILNWTPVPFNASNFTGSGSMVWTIGAASVILNRYARHGNVLFWQFYLSWFSGASVLSGTPAPTLIMAHPLSTVASAEQRQSATYCQGMSGVPVLHGLQFTIGLGNPYMTVTKPDNSNFLLSDIPGIITTVVIGV